MAQFHSVVGIDVSKQRWDVALFPDTATTASFDTDAAGQAALQRWLADHAAGCPVACEASGGYERPLIDLLLAAGIPVRRLDAQRVRRFAQAGGKRAKNDRIDAAMIAQFAATFPGPPVLPDHARERLAELVSLRDHLQAELTAANNQARLLRLPLARRIATQRAAALARWRTQLEAAITAAIAAVPALLAQAQLLQSVPGLGLLTAARLLALMPELGHIDARKAAALAGVAPFDHDSGRRRGHRSIAGGRSAVRAGLYMAALVATQHNPALRAFYERLRTRGKPAKLALTAVMRKLIVILTAILRQNTPWRDVTIPV